MSTITYTGKLTTCHCHCGIYMAVPDSLFDQAYNRGKTIYCPLGHTMTWRETETDRLRKRTEAAERKLAYEQSRRDQAEAGAREERERTAAARAEVARTRKRAAAGACPCCNRSFVQLQRHMATKHPEFLDGLGLPASITTWTLRSAAHEVVVRAGEPMTAAAVHGRLVLAGRRDKAASVQSSLYNLGRDGALTKVAPKTWVVVTDA